MLNFDAIGNALANHAVLVDAGHGWDTPGKRSNDDSLRENEFNSAVQDKVGMLLSLAGVDYLMVANGWKDEAPVPRVKQCNDYISMMKSEGKACIGVSIHADAFNDEDANGFTSFYFRKGDRYSENGKLLASDIQNSIDTINDSKGSITNDRGIKGANFFILRDTACPFVLVEAGFMTNDYDLSWLLTDEYRNDLAIAIVQGLAEYANR